MVKGTTRQVVVVRGADPRLFDQAIFLVRDDVVLSGGVSEEALLQEARRACGPRPRLPMKERLLWSGLGAGLTGLLWLLTVILL